MFMPPDDRDGSLARWRWVFVAVGVWDVVLGLAFFAFYEPIYDALNIALPDSRAYIHLAAALIAVQGLSYFMVARRPVRNADIVRVGVVYKATYSGLALYYWIAGGAPHGIFVAFGLVDVLTLVAFVAFLVWLRRSDQPTTAFAAA
jgi:hypothetical protein